MERLGVHKMTLRNVVVRSLILCVAALLLRFVYIASTSVSFQEAFGLTCDSGESCIFSSSPTVRLIGIRGARRPDSSGRVQFAVDPDVRNLGTSKEWRLKIDGYSAVFQNLTQRGYLLPLSKTLAIPAGNREEDAAQQVLALKEMGVTDAVGIGKKKIPPLVVSSVPSGRLPFEDNVFDVVFTGEGAIDLLPDSAGMFASEIGRVLRPGGIAVIHALAAKDMYSLNSFTNLFNCCRSLENRKSGYFMEFVLKKDPIHGSRGGVGEPVPSEVDSSNKSNICSVPKWKKELVKRAEPLIMEEPRKPWITLKRNIKNIIYLSTMVQIDYKSSYKYIDVGARSYGSSIGGWFKKQYPKQNQTFEIFAIEADHAFHADYSKRKGVKLLPYAAWLRNETLAFEVNGGNDDEGQKGRGMGRIRSLEGHMDEEPKEVMKVQAFDFAEWLMGTVSRRDFVVMKMDVEGTEFELIPWLMETGAICLIDEIFLECHYNRWQRTSAERTKKYQKTYSECLRLFTSLRESGVLVHQWW